MRVLCQTSAQDTHINTSSTNTLRTQLGDATLKYPLCVHYQSQLGKDEHPVMSIWNTVVLSIIHSTTTNEPHESSWADGYGTCSFVFCHSVLFALRGFIMDVRIDSSPRTVYDSFFVSICFLPVGGLRSQTSNSSLPPFRALRALSVCSLSLVPLVLAQGSSGELQQKQPWWENRERSSNTTKMYGAWESAAAKTGCLHTRTHACACVCVRTHTLANTKGCVSCSSSWRILNQTVILGFNSIH